MILAFLVALLGAAVLAGLSLPASSSSVDRSDPVRHGGTHAASRE